MHCRAGFLLALFAKMVEFVVFAHNLTGVDS